MRRPARIRATALALALLVLAGFHLATAAPAAACSCAGETDEQSYARASAVFVGELVAYQPPPSAQIQSSGDPAIWRFSVTKVYKGSVRAEEAIGSAVSGASCGLEIPRSGTFLVFAGTSTFLPETRVQGINLYADLCGGTRLESERAIPASFGTPTAPQPGATDIPGATASQQQVTHAARSALSAVFELVWLIRQTLARAFASLG
jgi:hypothetical protein